MMEDVVGLAIVQAVRSFGGNGGMFNSAGFSQCLCRLAGLKIQGIDGHLVEVILWGRIDVKAMPGGSHWQQERKD